ncbi:glycosyltransferase family 2 protein [Paenibacillus sp. FSL H8-0537]|uniref:tetratricopeptide repeat-containing glycosyltransferase family 2 protein n=1 Tax=Paenibacillus sp. FSL H8-0537 TaxID=2921399 RepID=UPI0031019AA0
MKGEDVEAAFREGGAVDEWWEEARTAESEKLRISLCMIVRDEERFLQGCLESVLPYVSEMIVVDTGSVDRTVKIAQSYGARVLQATWHSDFSQARNKGLEAAVQPWILVLDADERLEPLPLEQWQMLLADEERFGYYVQLISRVGCEGAEDELTDAVCRLFRNDERIRFAGAIHEETATAVAALERGGLPLAPVVVRHEGYRDEVIAARGKKQRNAAILQNALRRNPADPVLRYAMGTECCTYGDWEKAIGWLEPLTAELPPDCGYASDVLLKLSRSCLAMGMAEAAAHWADRGVQAFGYADFPDLYEAWAAALLELDFAEKALKKLEIALKLGTASSFYSSAAGAGSYRTMCGAGFCHERMYEWEAAADRYVSAIQARPDYAPAWERLLLLGAWDEEIRSKWLLASTSLLQADEDETSKKGGQAGEGLKQQTLLNHLLCKLAYIGLELQPEVSAQLIEALVERDQRIFWQGLLLVQQGDKAGGSQLWQSLPAGGWGEVYTAALDSSAADDSVSAGGGADSALVTQALHHVRAWQALCASGAPADAPPLAWCSLLRMQAASPGRRPAASPLAAGAFAAAAGAWPAAAVHFTAARAIAAPPWLARAAASGAAAAYASRARLLCGRRADSPAARGVIPAPAPLQSETELMQRISSALFPLRLL